MNCPICNRTPPTTEYIEKHHLTPKSRGGKEKETLLICVDCGDQIHKLFTNKELDKEFNTLEKLLADPRIQKWKEWVKNKKFGICMKNKKRR